MRYLYGLVSAEGIVPHFEKGHDCTAFAQNALSKSTVNAQNLRL